MKPGLPIVIIQLLRNHYVIASLSSILVNPEIENQPEKIKKRKPNPKENVKLSAEERKKVIKVSLLLSYIIYDIYYRGNIVYLGTY